MRKNNTAIILGGLFFSCSVMAGVGTLAPTVVPMVNGGQASIAISNTSPNLFTVPGDRIAASLPRLAEGNFRTMPVQTVTATTPSGSRPAVTAHPEQKLLAPRPLFTAAREVKTVVPVSSVTPVTPPRPLRTGEQTAALWIAPYIDNQDVYHQPSSVFFVIKPSAWGKPRIN